MRLSRGVIILGVGRIGALGNLFIGDLFNKYSNFNFAGPNTPDHNRLLSQDRY